MATVLAQTMCPLDYIGIKYLSGEWDGLNTVLDRSTFIVLETIVNTMGRCARLIAAFILSLLLSKIPNV